MDEFPKTELDRLVELARAGAIQAGEAFAQLVGHPVSTDDPVVRIMAETPPSAGTSSAAGLGSTGVFFEFEGCLDAIIGILFLEDASDLLIRRIVGIETGELESPIVESALMEVGNILASHVASAIADRLDARLLPSIPSLAMSDAEAEFESFVVRAVGAEAPRLESRLSHDEGEPIGRLVLVPTR